MEQYWPVFLTGMAIEFACLLFVHPAMFTLVVCLKTTVCTTMWFVHGPEAGAGVASTTKPKENKPVQVAPAAEVKSEVSLDLFVKVLIYRQAPPKRVKTHPRSRRERRRML